MSSINVLITISAWTSTSIFKTRLGTDLKCKEIQLGVNDSLPMKCVLQVIRSYKLFSIRSHFQLRIKSSLG